MRIAYRRKALGRHDLQLAETLARDGDPQAAAARREEAELVRHAIARLPAKYRDVLVLRWLEGLSVAETARLLDLNGATVKTRARRGMALLRSRMAPWALHLVFAGPWLLADSMRSAAGWGIFMNVKTTMTMTGVALAAAAVGLGVGVKATARESSNRRQEAPREAHAPPAIEAELAELRERAEVAERRLAEVRPEGAPPAPAAADAKPTFQTRYAAAGRDLGVSPEALAAVQHATEAFTEWLGSQNPQTQVALNQAFAALDPFGGEAFLAAVAHLRATDHPKTDYVNLMATTWELGLERHLIAIAQDPAMTLDRRFHALRGLTGADTPEVREFLLAELESAKRDKLIAGAAQSIAWLKDDRATPVLERLLYRPGKERHQSTIVNALGTFRSKEARRVLIEYVGRDLPPESLLNGVRALTWSDQEAAAVAAKRILEGPQAEKLSPNDRKILELTANR